MGISDERYVFRNNDNKVIMDTCLCGHHDIISYFDEYCGTNDFTVKVIEDDEDLYILIKFLRIDEQICIEEGKWYFV